MIVSLSVPRGSSVPRVPDRTGYLSYLLNYTNRDLEDEVIGMVGENIAPELTSEMA